MAVSGEALAPKAFYPSDRQVQRGEGIRIADLRRELSQPCQVRDCICWTEEINFSNEVSERCVELTGGTNASE